MDTDNHVSTEWASPRELLPIKYRWAMLMFTDYEGDDLTAVVARLTDFPVMPYGKSTEVCWETEAGERLLMDMPLRWRELPAMCRKSTEMGFADVNDLVMDDDQGDNSRGNIDHAPWVEAGQGDEMDMCPQHGWYMAEVGCESCAREGSV